MKNGLVIYGRPGISQVFEGTLRSAGLFEIPMERWTRAEALKRFPIYQPPEGFEAAFEPGAGFLHAERCVLAHAAEARKLGAVLRENETVLSYHADGEGVIVRTDKAEFSAGKLVIAGGSWSTRLMKDLGLPLKLRRMLLAWFKGNATHALQAGTPGFIFDLDDDFFYGFPQLDGQTVKMASHRGYELLEKPEDKENLPICEARVAALQGFIRRCLPEVTGELRKAVHCIYTMTPDEDFVIDLHPEHAQISYAAGFSGHGFKFSSVIGEILADLATTGATKHPIGFLRAKRFLN